MAPISRQPLCHETNVPSQNIPRENHCLAVLRPFVLFVNTKRREKQGQRVTSARPKQRLQWAWPSAPLSPPPPSADAAALASFMAPVASRIIYESFSSPAVLGRFALTACDVINHPSEMLCVPL